MIRHLRWVSIAAAVILSGCHAIVLDPRGPVGMAQKTILIDSLVIMLAIVIPTIIATLAFAWWFRASNSKARRLPDWSFSGSIELVVWAIPCMVIILLGGVTWIGSHELDPAKPLTSETPPLDIEVVSLDWQWLFIYPHQGVAIVNQLVVPAGTPLHFSLTSASVMNTFFIPQLGSMIYTMNGMATQLNLQANESGTFRGMSAHYSGEGFSDMHFDVHALPAAEFAAWVSRTRSENNVLDAKRYAALSRPTIAAPVALFGKVEPGLFAKIVALHLPPAPGPLAADDDAHRTQHAVQ
jgi:cytochrome o ubiquinol oxidase subunit 2